MKRAIPPVTTERQIDRLRQRGLWFEVIEAAHKLLAFISHHRVRSCWLRLEAAAGVEERPFFVRGATFEEVIRTYDFDERLRSLVLLARCTVEVAVRSSWKGHVLQKY